MALLSIPNTTLKLTMSKNDPLNTNILTSESKIIYTIETILHHRPSWGSKRSTTVTRGNIGGGNIGGGDSRLQVGVIEWPANPADRPSVIVGTRSVEMTKTGLYTAPEMFQASDGQLYEWQIRDYRSHLVPLKTPKSQAYVATFLTSSSRPSFFSPRKVHTASLFVPPEGIAILDDIIVTFVYFESQWRERERAKARRWDTPFGMG
ncbi:hypothetical protein BJ138DRAFT_1162358 [Hygrophoropsis aurantiaca]|uniref:Uncharacterized protein n=1 Tax=Hygrophoropsis aurantiaca TaxID=72124 RepID=A0ACB8A1J4_9AGAM|nr:hypothetical protein BJ138DRAFT_1162358 [Hygrophoropsis aurantiaca]